MFFKQRYLSPVFLLVLVVVILACGCAGDPGVSETATVSGLLRSLQSGDTLAAQRYWAPGTRSTLLERIKGFSGVRASNSPGAFRVDADVTREDGRTVTMTFTLSRSAGVFKVAGVLETLVRQDSSERP